MLPLSEKREPRSNRSTLSYAKVLWGIAGPLVALAACTLLLALINGLSRGLDYHGVTQALRETPHVLIWISILLTALSYVALIARDLCGLSYVGVKISTPALLLASFCGSALSATQSASRRSRQMRFAIAFMARSASGRSKPLA